MLPLRFAPVWAAVGWLGVVLAVVLSLWPGGVPLPVHLWFKAQHTIGYFILALWFLGMYPRSRYLLIAAGCFVLGIAIEGLQAFTPTRSAEFDDILINGIGIAAALLVAYLGMGGWALKLERLAGLHARA